MRNRPRVRRRTKHSDGVEDLMDGIRNGQEAGVGELTVPHEAHAVGAVLEVVSNGLGGHDGVSTRQHDGGAGREMVLPDDVVVPPEPALKRVDNA